MGSIGAVQALQVLENVEEVLAIELLTAAQALDFRTPLRPGRGVEIAHEEIRAAIPHRTADAAFDTDLTQCRALVQSTDLLDAIGEALSPVQ